MAFELDESVSVKLSVGHFGAFDPETMGHEFTIGLNGVSGITSVVRRRIQRVFCAAVEVVLLHQGFNAWVDIESIDDWIFLVDAKSFANARSASDWLSKNGAQVLVRTARALRELER